MFNAPLVNIDEASAPRLLPIAERRLAAAKLVNDEFAKLKVAETPELLSLAIDSWANAFEIHLERRDIGARNIRGLTTGASLSGHDEAELQLKESQAMDSAVLAQQEVMDKWGIEWPELEVMMFEACNELRREIGMRDLNRGEYDDLYAQGMAGQRPRFYS